MKLTTDGYRLTVTREPGDRRYYTESNFLHAVKLELNKRGLTLVKRLMWKDGHMVSDDQHYLKPKNNKGVQVWLYNDYYAVRGLNDDFDALGYCHIALDFGTPYESGLYLSEVQEARETFLALFNKEEVLL